MGPNKFVHLTFALGAIMLAYGIMTALVARERYGVGQEVSASHLGSMVALQGLNISSKTILGKEFPRNTRDVNFLLDEYTQRFVNDFLATLPPSETRPPSSGT